jgi:hypothetical protein
MREVFRGDIRGASTVTGTILMVAVVVILASVVGAFVFGLGPSPSPPAPQASLSHTVLDDAGVGGDDIIAVTLESGTAIETENLYVIGSTKLDIGGAPDGPRDEWASEREKFTEAASGDPQVGIGETWDSGETVYLNPVGKSADGVTVKIYWTTRPVEGYNPGTVEGEDSYKIAEFTV